MNALLILIFAATLVISLLASWRALRPASRRTAGKLNPRSQSPEGPSMRTATQHAREHGHTAPDATGSRVLREREHGFA